MRITTKRAQRLYQMLGVFGATILISVASLEADGQQAEQVNPASARTQSAVRRLEAGKPIEREMKGGEEHGYEITLQAKQYLNVVVEQKGIDVAVHVTAPDGEQIMEVDSPNGNKGPEPVELIAKVPGNYTLSVKSLESNAPIGKYDIKVITLRAATDDDRISIERAQALSDATKLNDRVMQLIQGGKYDEALPLAERALAIRKKVVGTNHAYVAASLNELAFVYYLKGNYAKAEQFYVRALAIREKVLDAGDPDTAQSVNNLALLYQTIGDYVKAEPLHVRALAIRERALGQDHPFVGNSVNNLASLYESKGDYAKAELLYLRAFVIREKALGKDHPLVAQSLNNLAALYQTRGDYAKGEPMYVRALAIYEKALGKDHPDVAASVNNLAGLYLTKGDYAKTEPLYLRALAIVEKALGKDHPYVASCLSNLALLYQTKGAFEKAEPLYIRALAIFDKALGRDHVEVARSLNNLARLYESKGFYTKAEPLYLRALAIGEKALGKDHPLVAQSLNNLARLYLNMGDYARAEPLLVRALPTYEKALGTNHPFVTTALNNLAELYYAEGDSSKAILFQIRANETDERELVRNLFSGSERQKLAYLNRNSYITDLTLSLQIITAPNNIDIRRAALSRLLRRKGRALDAMADVIAVVRRRASLEDQKLLDQLAEARAQRSKLVNRGVGKDSVEQYRTKLIALEDREELLENKLSERSVEFRSQLLPIALEKVQKAIPQNAVLIEFASYRPFDPKELDREKRYGRPHYAVYLLRNHGEPIGVELGEAKPIDDAVAAFRQSLRDKVRKNVKVLARAVDAKVMQPVRKLLGNTRRVFLSPDGALNLIPFAALVDEHGEYLVKRYHFTYLTSGRDLLRLQDKIRSKGAPIVIADADFDNSANSNQPSDGQSATIKASSANVANGLTNASDGRLGPRVGEVEFEPLKRLVASAEEAREVKRTLKQATVVLRNEATESALKQVSGPSILHIATHGYFLEEEVKPASKTSESTRIAVRRKGDNSTASVKLENPSLRSGLFFSGANRGKSGDDDGVLTALEAAGLDLWGTKLVVLSACDTGVGEVLNGQGVQGLRRALVLAGSESQMMSLWAVSDVGTRELMIAYYRRLKAGKGRSEALRQVQLKMLASKNRNHPFYWASFIQSGEWANLDGKRVD